MNKIALSVILASSLLACGGSQPGEPDSNGVAWAKRSTSGFEAVVRSNFTLKDMQDTFGSYCKRNGKTTRSLRMEPDENGKKRVIGDCL